jgi:hypothetical protein
LPGERLGGHEAVIAISCRRARIIARPALQATAQESLQGKPKLPQELEDVGFRENAARSKSRGGAAARFARPEEGS